MLLFNPQKFTLPLSLKHRGNAVANIENISLSCKCFKEKLEKHHFHKACGSGDPPLPSLEGGGIGRGREIKFKGGDQYNNVKRIKCKKEVGGLPFYYLVFCRSLTYQVHELIEFRCDDDLGTTVTLLT